jgi:hypothetical protein
MAETQKPNVDTLDDSWRKDVFDYEYPSHILNSVLARLEAIKSHAETYRGAEFPTLHGLERMDRILKGIADWEGWNIPAIATD